MYRKYLMLLLFGFAGFSAFACSVCEKQQPKMLQGITHGTGPQSDWDYVIIWAVAIIVVATLFFSVKWLVWPGEKSPAHIKRLVLKNN